MLFLHQITSPQQGYSQLLFIQDFSVQLHPSLQTYMEPTSLKPVESTCLHVQTWTQLIFFSTRLTFTDLNWLKSTLISPRFTPASRDEFIFPFCLPVACSSSSSSVTLHLNCQNQNISGDKSYREHTHITTWKSSHIMSIYSACWTPLAQVLLMSIHCVGFTQVYSFTELFWSRAFVKVRNELNQTCILKKIMEETIIK